MPAVLVITCSSGGGHITASNSVSSRLTQAGHQVITLDIAPFFYPVQKLIIPFWNTGVRHDWRIVHDLDRFLVFYETMYEYCFTRPLTEQLTALIGTHDIRIIYDTQPTFTHLITQIFSRVCTQKGYDGEYHKVFTDLPYPGNRHFLGSLKRCKHPHNVRIYAHAPDTVPMNITRDFWGDYARLTPTQIKKTFALPVHDLYFDESHRDKAIALHCPLTRYCENSLQATDSGFTLKAGTLITTLMLGSQGLDATFQYAKQFLAQAKNTQQPALFFVACAKNERLYEKIFTYANAHNLPHAQVLPLPQISQDILASLMWQSDRHIIRPGGLSCLEQLALRQHPHNANKPLWLHSGMHSLTYTLSANPQLIKGCYGHERANAQHMLASTRSAMVIPSTIQFFHAPSSA